MIVHEDPALVGEPALARIVRPNRLRLLLRGPDRAKFLQNLTTNDILRVQPGHGCETFVTSLQGKTLGYLSVHAMDDRMWLRSEENALEGLRPHFDKYSVFDNVSWTDETAATFEIHVVGPDLDTWLARLGVAEAPAEDLSIAEARIGDRDASLIRESPTGRPGLTILGMRDDQPALAAAFQEAVGPAGFTEIDPDHFDVMRIEAGTPVFGKDVTAANLPQELVRDHLAISFTKGCYLGQETVARIDALGHVNKMLQGLQFDPGAVPPAGTELRLAGKAVGTVTSSGFSPRLGIPVGLGYVRRAHARPGQQLELDVEGIPRTANVVRLPMHETGGAPVS